MEGLLLKIHLRNILLFVFLAIFVTPTHADADKVYFVIKSGRDATVYFPVTDAVLAKIGLISYQAVLPGMDDKFHVVRGPLMRDLLVAAGIEGETALGMALDKYEVDIPTQDFKDYDVIAAIEVDGKAISVREKGPAWIVYPTVDHAELRKDPVYEARSIWQLKELTIK